MMKKVRSGEEPVSIHAYEVTPDQLREIATRLEKKEADPGEIVRVPFASNAEFFYNPHDRLKHITPITKPL